MASSIPSRRDRFVDTDQTTFIPLDRLQKSILDVYDMAFRWYQSGEIKMEELLTAERSYNRDYDNAWKEAKRKFETKKIELSTTVGTKSLSDMFQQAVIVYSLEKPPVYREFNKLSRGLTETTWEQFPYKSLWLMLSVSLTSLVSDPPLPAKGTVLYRGVDCYYNEFNPLGVTKCVIFKNFASCTTSKQVALGFLRDKGTLIEFHYRPMAGSGIRKHSMFPEEDEVLLCPWGAYEVQEHVTTGEIHRLILKVSGLLSGCLPYNLKFRR